MDCDPWAWGALHHLFKHEQWRPIGSIESFKAEDRIEQFHAEEVRNHLVFDQGDLQRVYRELRVVVALDRAAHAFEDQQVAGSGGGAALGRHVGQVDQR